MLNVCLMCTTAWNVCLMCTTAGMFVKCVKLRGMFIKGAQLQFYTGFIHCTFPMSETEA